MSPCSCDQSSAWCRSAVEAASRAVHSAGLRPGQAVSLPGPARRSAARAARRTSGAVPDSARRAPANVRIVSSMLNRLCSLPRVTTSQEESTRPRIRWGRAGPASATPCTSARVNDPANTLSTASSRCSRAQQVVAGLEDVHQPTSQRRCRPGRVEQDGALLQDLPHGQRADPASDQLDGQGEAVKPAAQLADGVGWQVGDAETGQPFPGPRDEQLNGVGPGDVRYPGGGGRALQRWHNPAHLARRAEHHPAGDDDPHPGAAPSRSLARVVTASRRCSAPSSTISRGASARAAVTDSGSGTPARSGTRRPAARSVIRDSGWRTVSSGMNATGTAGRCRPMASTASRVFPAPPGPIRVSSRSGPAGR